MGYIGVIMNPFTNFLGHPSGWQSSWSISPPDPTKKNLRKISKMYFEYQFCPKNAPLLRKFIYLTVKRVAQIVLANQKITKKRRGQVRTLRLLKFPGSRKNDVFPLISASLEDWPPWWQSKWLRPGPPQFIIGAMDFGHVRKGWKTCPILRILTGNLWSHGPINPL